MAARFIAPLPSEPSTWTHLESPRPLTIRGRQLTFADIAITDERLTGQRADGPFATNSPTILVHYASWCLPCAAELPEVFALARAFSDISTIEIPASSDISKIKTYPRPAHRAPAIVFVSHDEIPGPQALLASFEDLLAKARLTATDLPPGLSLRADPEGRFARALTQARLPIADPAALPSTWLLDRRGRLVAHLAGPLTAAHRETLLAELEALR